MADGGSLNKPIPVPEAVSSSPEMAPETPSQQRVDLALDLRAGQRRLGENPADPVREAIQRLDPTRPISEQVQEMAKLRIILKTLIMIALSKSSDLEALKKELRENPGKILPYAKTEVEKEAVQKWIDVYLAQPRSAQAWWEGLEVEMKEDSKKAQHVKDALERREHPEETQWMSSTLKWSLVAAGALGVAGMVYYWLTPKDERKVVELAGSSVLAVAGLGALVGSEQLGKWSAEYLDISVTDKAFHDFWENAKKGEMLKAFQSLEFTTQAPGVKEIAKKLKIEEKVVMELKDVTWGTFGGYFNDAKRAGRSFLYSSMEALGLAGLPGISLDDETETAVDEQKLKDFIEEHKSKITGDLHKMTIGEILAQFKEKGLFGDEPLSHDVEDSSEETPPDSNSTEVQRKLSNMPRAKAGLEQIKAGEYQEGMVNFLEGVVLDGGSLAINSGGGWLIKGAMIVPLSNFDIVTSQFIDLIQAATGMGEWKDVIGEYDQLYWVGTYAAVAAGQAFFEGGTPKAKFLATVEGAKWGLIDSYLFVPRKGLQATRMIWNYKSNYEYLRYRYNETMALSPEAKAQLLHAETAYYAQQYQDYFAKTEAVKSSKITTKLRGYLSQAFWTKGGLENMKTKYAKKYFESYQRFMQMTGRSNTMASTVNLDGITKGESTVMGELRKSAAHFTTENPATALPDGPGYLVRARYSTMSAADAAGLRELPTLAPDTVVRMDALNLNHERIQVRFREMGFDEADIKQLLGELEKSGNPRVEARNFEMRLWAIKNPKAAFAFKAFKGTAGVLGVVGMIYSFENSKDKWNEAAAQVTGLGAFEAGMAAGQYLPIPHPVVKELAAMAVGVGFYAGGYELWMAYAKPSVDKYFPNRNEILKSKIAQGVGFYAANVTGAGFLGTVAYAADAAGIGDGIDADTDPLEYLKVTQYTWHWDYVKKNFEGDLTLPFGDHRMHDLGDLRANAEEAKKEYLNTQKNLQEQIQMKKDALLGLEGVSRERIELEKTALEQQLLKVEEALVNFETYIDNSWIQIKRMQMVYLQMALIDPAYRDFTRLSVARFGSEAEEVTARLMGRLQSGEMKVQPDEMEIWQFLCDQKVDLDGGSINFADFACMAVLNTNGLKFLDKLERDEGLKNTPSGLEEGSK